MVRRASFDILFLVDGPKRVSRYINNLSLEAQASLWTAADRFDCERIQNDIMTIFNYRATRYPSELLKYSSEINAVVPAKVAIAHLSRRTTDGWQFSRKAYWPHSSANDWWSTISCLRPTWQLELTRLFWEGGRQLVDRPEEQRPRKRNGHATARIREQALHQTRKTYAQIADRFDPPPCNCSSGLKPDGE
jgi:hypothetical protein